MNDYRFTPLPVHLNTCFSTIMSPLSTWFFRLGQLVALPGLLSACSLVNLIDHPVPPAQRVQQAVDKIRSDLEKELRNPVPSLTVLIQTPTQKILASSVPAGNAPLTGTTYLRFASNTKNFTATAILNMHEDGWLDYKANISDLIPGTNEPYVPAGADWNIPSKNQITIEQLLQHSAGVYDTDNDPVPGLNGESYVNYVQTRDSTHQFTTEQLIKPLIDHQLRYFAPGTGYHYSNTGYAILSRIIERVYSAKSGRVRTYADYLNDRVTGSASQVPISVSFPDRALLHSSFQIYAINN